MSGLFRVLIFATGGSIIALELLASRIMTPYFGVSLYIWSGILSITLVALALGYYGGGWLAQRIAGRRDEGGQLAHLFLLMPAIAALGLALSCLIYPWAFFYLARADVVLGAFAACLVLLFVPLVATSAMNPLLVAVQRSLREAGATAEADAGAGRVLFISTAGSVAGVLITAFVLIPNVTNFTAVLWIAVALGLISAVTPYLVRGVIHRRRLIVILGAAGAAASVILLALSDWMLGRSTEISHGGARWRLERAYGSLFGSVKVLKAASAGAPDQFVRYFYQDGIVQNRVDAQGVSQTLFTYALEAIAMGYRPEAKSALMLGLGAGVVPMRLARRGVDVEIVEINPASWVAAESFFGFEPQRFRNHLADARSFVRLCGVRREEQRHDIILVDLFHGDGTPEYLVTREFFADVRRCLKPGGIVVLNTFADMGRLDSYAHLLATLRTEFATLLLFRGDAPADAQVNSFLLATNGPTGSVAQLALSDLPAHLEADMRWALARPRLVDRGQIGAGRIVSDAHNFLSFANAATYLAYRRSVVGSFPRQFLVN